MCKKEIAYVPKDGVWVVKEGYKVISTHDFLMDAVNSDLISMPYCPNCFLPADQCVEPYNHYGTWEW